MQYNHKEIEENWQNFWAKNQTFKASNNSKLPKYYVLDMFPYPEASAQRESTLLVNSQFSGDKM